MAKIGNDIDHAAQLLSQGKLVAIPTETVYGLAGNAMNDDAILSIYKAKNRPKFDPLIAHVASLSGAKELSTNIPEVLLKIMSDWWPGPLTVLLEKSKNVSDLQTSGSTRVAVRMPDHPITLSLLNQLPFSLAAPSANPFGYISPTTSQHVAAQLGDKIDYILEGGPCQVGVESTIIGMEADQLMVYRLGGIPIEKIEKYAPVKLHLNQSSNPQAPGMIKSHYAPGKKLILGDIETLITESHTSNFGVISLSKNYREVLNSIQLSKEGSLDEAAKNLFGALRTMDESDVEVIYAEWMPEQGLGRAINDRLRRAAAR